MMGDLSFVLCYLSPIISCQFSAICSLSSVLCHLFSVIYHLQKKCSNLSNVPMANITTILGRNDHVHRKAVAAICGCAVVGLNHRQNVTVQKE